MQWKFLQIDNSSSVCSSTQQQVRYVFLYFCIGFHISQFSYFYYWWFGLEFYCQFIVYQLPIGSLYLLCTHYEERWMNYCTKCNEKKQMHSLTQELNSFSSLSPLQKINIEYLHLKMNANSYYLKCSVYFIAIQMKWLRCDNGKMPIKTAQKKSECELKKKSGRYVDWRN